MTAVTVTWHNGGIVSVEATGHTGFSGSGTDIVCAAVSAVIQTAGLGVKGVAGLDAKIIISDGNYSLTLPKIADGRSMEIAGAILETMLIGLKDLASGYPKHIKIKEITGV